MYIYMYICVYIYIYIYTEVKVDGSTQKPNTHKMAQRAEKENGAILAGT